MPGANGIMCLVEIAFGTDSEEERTMGNGRMPGPQRLTTLRMRSPSPGDAANALKDVNITFLEGSAHPLAFRVVRTNPLTVTVGTNDVDVTVGADKPPDTQPL